MLGNEEQTHHASGKRKQTPTDGFNIQQMNSQIFHTSVLDGLNEIEMQTRQTAHTTICSRLQFPLNTVQHVGVHGGNKEVRKEEQAII